MNPIRHDILDAPQFTRDDVLRVTGLTSAQLKNTLDRDLVTLSSQHNPGTGRRRLFTGGDILKLTAAHTMSGIGFPMKWFYLVADDIYRRATRRRIETELGAQEIAGYGFLTYPMSNGDWARIALYDGMAEPDNLPVAYQVVEVDRLIDRVMAKLEALAQDEEPPEFPDMEPDPEPSPYSPENDFFRAWTQDEEGRDVRVGLTFDETLEYEQRILDRDPSDFDARERFLELLNRHEAARQARLASEFRERWGAKHD